MSTPTPRILAMPRTFVEVSVESAMAIARLRAAMFAGLCAVIFAAPLAMGAVFDWSVLALEIAGAALFLLWVARELSAHRAQLTWNPLFLPAAGFGAVIATQIIFHTSAVAYLTRYAAIPYLAYGALMFVAVQTVETDDEFRRFATIAICFGFAVALFAIVQDLTFNGMVYWRFKAETPSHPFGPYVNRNHYAGLMELLAPLPLVLAVVLRTLTGGKRALLAVVAVVMFGSVALSLSRGGMLAIVAEVILLAIYVASRRAIRAAALLGIACALIAVFLWWVGSEQIMMRFAAGEGGMSAQTRLQITRASLRMAKQRPVLGWGLGTFATVFPPFRDFYGDRYINQAHNDYAQVLAETGILGSAALMWFAVAVVSSAKRRLNRAENYLTDAVKLGLLLGCAGLMVHSFVDFNLQIPANALLFYVFAALAASRDRTQRGLLPASAPGKAGAVVWSRYQGAAKQS